MVPRRTQGVSVTERQTLVGLDVVNAADVILADVRVDASMRLGDGDLLDKLDSFYAGESLLHASRAVGVAQSAYQYAPGLCARAASLRASPLRIFKASLSCSRICTCKSNPRAHWFSMALGPWTPQASDAICRAHQARAQADEMAFFVTDSAVQILGGHGYIQDHPVEKWMRDVRALALLHGSREISETRAAAALVDAPVTYDLLPLGAHPNRSGADMRDFSFEEGLKNMQAMLHWFAENELRPVALAADRNHQIPGGRDRQDGGVRPRRPSTAAPFQRRQQARQAPVDLSQLDCVDRGASLGRPQRALEHARRRLGRATGAHDGHRGAKRAFFCAFCRQERFELRRLRVDRARRWHRCCQYPNHRHARWRPLYLEGHQVLHHQRRARRGGWWSLATVDKTAGRAGQRAFVVERGTPGFKVGKIEEKMGLRASETAELVFDECRVSADNLLGGEARYETRGQDGFVGAMKTFDATRPAVASMAIGIARGAWELARDHFKTHYMVGRPIARYHLIAETLSKNARQLHAARLACWRAAWMADCGLPNSKEASMSKALAAQTAMAVCRDAIQIIGAAGTTQALLCEKFFRDIKVYDIFEGTAQAQRLVIAKRLIENLARF